MAEAVSMLLKHSLTVFIPSAALVLIISFYSYHRDIAVIHTDLAAQAQISLNSAINATEHSLAQIKRDVHYLAGAQALMAAIDENRPEDVTNLINDWRAFSRSKQIYDQIRWIDETGMEKVRINYRPEQAVVVPAAELQDNSQRYFFLDTMKLNANEIYISPLDLNIEGDQIEQPWKPTIRVGTHVFDATGKSRGIVIVNYLGRDLLERLRPEHGSGLWMTNAEGFWLLGPTPSDEWGFMFNNRDLNISRRYPEAWMRIANQDSAGFETSEGYWLFHTVHPLEFGQKTDSAALGLSSALLSGSTYAWKLIHFQPRSGYDSRVAEVDHRYGLFVALMLGGLALGSWLLARSRYAEARALIEAANACRAKQDVEHAHAEAMTERAAQLQIAMEAANQASHAKSEFVTNMSHEIRTPINAILGLVYLLEQQELTPTMRCMVKQVGVASKSLLGIVNDILDFSRIEAKRITIEHVPFRLSNVLDNLAGIMSTALGEKPVEMVFTPLPPGCDELKGDPLRLAQVLTNLTINAIKFTEQGEVIVAITRLDHAETANHVRLRFSVRDTGIGIPAEKLQQVFEAFSQSDNSSTRQFGGSGLGLTISRHLIHLMGGDLRVNSEVGKGSEFYFELDFEITAHSSLPEMLYQRILVADDNRIARDVLANTAASLGWQVDAVDSGEKAVEMASRAVEKPYDVLLIDWRMPGGDGIAAASTIREKYPDQTAPIIVMVTAYDRELLREQPGSEVADVLLNKPVTTSSLYNAVAEAKSQRGQLHINGSMPPENFLLRNIRVLIVDDSEINREVARQILNYHGAETEVAIHGEEALRILKASPEGFDIVLMDVQMPVMDGYTATREMRSSPELAHLPVVALTAGAYKVHQLAAFDSGMNEYISKPFEVDELLDVICRLTKKSAPPSATVDAPVSADSSPHLPPASDTSLLIDVHQGLRNWGGQADYHKYLNIFLRDHAEDGRAIVDAIAQENFSQALALAHRLRGVAGSLSLPYASRLAGDLEQALIENINVSVLATLLAETLARTIQAIRVMVDPTTNVAPMPSNEDQ